MAYLGEDAFLVPENATCFLSRGKGLRVESKEAQDIGGGQL